MAWIGTLLAYIARGDPLRVPVVIDTEIGDNIDDAFAIALAVNSPEIELLGVTTTFYLPRARALIARRLLGAYGELHVPVSIGLSPRYQGEPPAECDTFTQMEEAIPKVPLGEASPLSALEWLEKVTAQRRGIVYVANGPLTNLADFLRRYPDRVTSFRQVVLMGGWVTQRLPEWNISQDPKAAEVVLSSGIPIVLIGREVTLGCILTQAQRGILFNSGLAGTSFLMTLYQHWAKAMGNTPPIMYDPLTVMYLCDPSVVTLEPVRVRVKTEPGANYGVLYRAMDGWPVQMAIDVDRGRYLNTLVSRLTEHVVTPEWYPVELLVVIRDALVITYPADWQMRRSTTAKHILAYVLDGEGMVEARDGTTTSFQSGDILYLPPDTPHQLSTTSGMAVSMLYFECWQMQGGERQDYTLPLVDGGLVLSLPDPSYVQSRVEQIIDLWMRPSFGNMFLCNSKLLALIAHLCSLAERSKGDPSSTQEMIEHVKTFLEQNVEENITLDLLAKEFQVSKFHLIRLFKQELQITPIQYHRSLKMRRARTLLELEHLSVKEIAHRLGYSSVQVFSRAFKAETGISPRVYQRLANRS